MFAEKRAEVLLETLLLSMRGKRANEHDITLVRDLLVTIGRLSVGAGPARQLHHSLIPHCSLLPRHSHRLRPSFIEL